ncbi:MAG TPA: tRNA guanosine(34) transglycosylase Tgt [Tepidisphaeraceae bacterium]|jgi:queuine tRNA-ribosyltransferase|nr:tRNA guanosine(34) transglycosylase Tgt [Tepidisphaeraceae bacterium]
MASIPKAVTYELIHQDRGSGARLGKVRTPHGLVDTPAFMPVGTQGSIKGVLPDQVAKTGTQLVLANTYHLMLRPGEKTVAELGDLHRLMGWAGPILTDSGGFQVFSLADLNEVSDRGVTFKSHVDGSEVFLDARRSIEVQNDLGADIMMAFDQCPAGNADAEVHRQAVRRTLRWAEQSLAAHGRRGEQGLFGIVQGGVDLELRQECARELAAMGFDGYALGGLAVGEGFEGMKGVLREIGPALPADKPRYLMGVGYPRDIVTAVAAGIDLFDCVLPTRNGRNAYAFTADGPIRLRNSAHQRDPGPIEQGCDCYSCGNFSRGAIRHFFFAGEMLGPVLVSVHNVRFYQRLMADIRRSIGEGSFDSFVRNDSRCRLGPSE